MVWYCKYLDSHTNIIYFLILSAFQQNTSSVFRHPWLNGQGHHQHNRMQKEHLGQNGSTPIFLQKLTWNIIMEVWKIIFLSKWVICRFHVNFPGSTPPKINVTMEKTNHISKRRRKTPRCEYYKDQLERPLGNIGDGKPTEFL